MDVQNNFLDHFGKEIRLTEERWSHILEQHPELFDQESLIEQTLCEPDFIQEGSKGELLAIKLFKKTPVSENKYGVVVYRHDEPAGFVITSYFTRRPSFRRQLVWKK